MTKWTNRTVGDALAAKFTRATQPVQDDYDDHSMCGQNTISPRQYAAAQAITLLQELVDGNPMVGLTWNEGVTVWETIDIIKREFGID